MNLNESEPKEQYYKLDSNSIIFTSVKSYFTYIDGTLIGFIDKDTQETIENMIKSGGIETIDTCVETVKLYKPNSSIKLVGTDHTGWLITYSYGKLQDNGDIIIEEHKVTEEYIKELVSKATK
jgi:hypothetical protein|nr:hypothetical protein [uncultured Lachnoclostridium sp.]